MSRIRARAGGPVKEAVDLGVPAPVISASLQRRFRSRQEDSFGERILAALRAEFGATRVKKVVDFLRGGFRHGK